MSVLSMYGEHRSLFKIGISDSSSRLPKQWMCTPQTDWTRDIRITYYLMLI